MEFRSSQAFGTESLAEFVPAIKIIFAPIISRSSTTTIYEFYGDYWHGNPNSRFKPDDMNKAVKKTFRELYQATIQKEQELIAAGYKIVSIWESDWKKLLKNQN